MITGLYHVGMSVPNMDRALEFYRDLLGMEVIVRRPFGYEGSYEWEKHRLLMGLKDAQGEVVLLRRGDMYIELFEFHRPAAKQADLQRPVCDHGFTHICLAVDDIHLEYDRLRAAGVTFHCPPQLFPGKGVATYGRDGDGNIFELMQFMK
jgi:catechol 2,3-dioxygenase-like lactoylglutathione lyase family enzyme